MKNCSLLLFLLLPFLSPKAQGIAFDNTSGSWEEVLGKARELARPIFVDVYTSWCGPCKWLDSNVFNQPEVGIFFNEKFISIKVNAEEGYGKTFKENNKVGSYPTLLFFSPEGEMILVHTGTLSSSTLINIGTDAINNLKTGVSLEAMHLQMKNGNNNPEFLLKYIKKLSSLHSPNATLLEEYLRVIPEDSLYTPATLKMISRGYFGRMPVDGLAFKILLREYKLYPIKSLELMSPWNVLNNRLVEYTKEAGQLNDSLWLKEIFLAIDAMDTIPQIASSVKDYLECVYYSAGDQSDKFMEKARIFADKYITNANADSIYRSDSIHFNNALLIKFGTSNLEYLKTNNNFLNFKKSYFTDSKLTLTMLLEIVRLHNNIPIGVSLRDSVVIAKWKERAINLYRRNPVHVNEYLLK